MASCAMQMRTLNAMAVERVTQGMEGARPAGVGHVVSKGEEISLKKGGETDAEKGIEMGVEQGEEEAAVVDVVVAEALGEVASL